MEPVKLKSALMGLPYWPLGGTKLKEEFHKELDSETIAQSWELSAHEFGQSLIDSGPDKGLKLGDYVKKHGFQILGNNSQKYDRFPLLIKFLDNKKNLFIQVHPDDEYAFRVEHEPGKMEMYYFFEADENSYIYVGFNKDVTEEDFLNKLVAGEVLDLVNKVKVHPGDAVLVPAGTIHALCAGTFCIEIQQNSNTTYNLWNFGEKPGHRGFQIKKALDVLNYHKLENPFIKQGEIITHDGYTSRHVVSSKYFDITRLDVKTEAKLKATKDSFIHLLCYDGQGEVVWNDGSIKYQKGDSIFIPAGDFDFTIEGTFIGLSSKAN